MALKFCSSTFHGLSACFKVSCKTASLVVTSPSTCSSASFSSSSGWCLTSMIVACTMTDSCTRANVRIEMVKGVRGKKMWRESLRLAIYAPLKRRPRSIQLNSARNFSSPRGSPTPGQCVPAGTCARSPNSIFRSNSRVQGDNHEPFGRQCDPD
jgi:hypothetical protein